MFDFILQAVATALLFYGIWQCGNVRRRGPFSLVIAEILFIIVGVLHPETWSIAVVGLVLGIIQARNYLKWTNEGKEW